MLINSNKSDDLTIQRQVREEVLQLTTSQRCIFIRVVTAVIVPITLPASKDTAAVTAAEAVVGAGHRS